MKKFLVFIRRSNPRSFPAGWEFDTAEEVAKFLVNEDPHRVSIFVKADGLDFGSGTDRLARQLDYMVLDSNLDL